MMPPRRKKWTEAEEKTLIEKYGQMVSDGTLAKMKTREKKYKPIALYVNYMHHVRDPNTYPWQWTWKDVSTKVQNMRHQYLLVKQKVKKPDVAVVVENSAGGEGSNNVEEFDWVEGLTHWSNFLLYKEVFGDVPMAYSSNGSDGNDLICAMAEDRENGGLLGVGGGIEIGEFGPLGNSVDGDFTGIDGGENGIMGLGFDYEGEEAEENCNSNDRAKEEGDDGFMYEEVDVNASNLKKRKVLKGLEKRVLGFLSNQMGQLREMESRFEQQEVERERERQRREIIRIEKEQEWEQKLEEREREREEREKAREELRWQRYREWEAMEKESDERQRRRRDEELIQEKEWEDRMKRRRLEWKKRIDGMLNQHRDEMGQMHSRILHEQQNLTSQFLGIVSQWTGHPSGLSDHTSASNHYLSQMMQNLHHVNGMVHEDARVDGDNQDDQFIVDG
ncbi:uncharacterized protein LOC126669833 [Mercurialis annua]|uniref:uncharacterized protein LOC126669833 n=1 Tax=Mercurialis annua TaxID=3986 RepID=UPI00215F8041|nr:uncharacterized protein LOC126669833 [Mercurialis annua]